MNYVEAEIEKNMYGFALIMPLVRGRRAHGGWRFHWRLYTSSLMGLVVNFVLQTWALVELHQLAREKETDGASRVFTLCQKFDMSMNSYRGEGMIFRGSSTNPKVAEGSHTVWDCSPLALTLLELDSHAHASWSSQSSSSELSMLDSNGDGFWTLDEAEALKQHMENATGRLADMPSIFGEIAALARQGDVESRQDTGQSPFLLSTRNYTAIPMAWVQAEQRWLGLCAITMPDLCGNLEFHDALKARMPGIAQANRVAKCEDFVTNRCPQVFGERFKLYSTRAGDICQEPRYFFPRTERVRIARYKMADRFSNPDKGILQSRYFFFLLAMLVLWELVMTKELRLICRMWRVLLFMPTETNGEQATIEKLTHDVEETECDHMFRINAIPTLHSRLAIWVVVVPRALLGIGTLLVGCQFLINADSFTELLLNSVALGFLVEVDEMLFNAVVSNVNQRIVQHCEPLRVGTEHMWEGHSGLKNLYYACRSHSMASIMVVLLCLSCWLPYSAFKGSRGKFDQGSALECLCQAVGNDCLANILGGFNARQGGDNVIV